MRQLDPSYADHRIVGTFVDIGAFELQNTPPQITLNGDNPFILECGTPFADVDPGATADDAQDGDLTDDTSDTAELYGIGRVGDAVHVCKVTIEPVGASGEMAIVASGWEDADAP